MQALSDATYVWQSQRKRGITKTSARLVLCCCGFAVSLAALQWMMALSTLLGMWPMHIAVFRCRRASTLGNPCAQISASALPYVSAACLYLQGRHRERKRHWR